MAKDKGPDGHPETPSTTTSGGKYPQPAGDKPATGAADGDAAKGTAVYPPSPSDQAGQKTDNVAPSKELPPDVPPEEGGSDELTRLRAENVALANTLKNFGGNPQAVTKAATEGLTKEAKKAKGPVRKAFVRPAAGGEEVEVEIPADTPADQRDGAAVAAYQRKAGIWSLPQQPGVRHEEPGARRGKKAGEDEK